MKILAPINKSKEVEQIIKQGADELYCGVMPVDWRDKFTNVASPNRREWTSANLSSLDELKKTVDIAHAYQTPVYLTINSFYSNEQYPLILKQIEQTKEIGVDGFIIADIGLLLALKRLNLDVEIHISNTGTVFNSETIEFYKDLGASRIILPRQLMVDEIDELVKGENEINFEVFIMNSGCKNIDGFCAFHHGVNEIFHPFVWNFFKRLNFDRHLLELIMKLPLNVSSQIKSNICGIDSACLLNYTVSLISGELPEENGSSLCQAISTGFSLISGVDPCGGCDVYKLKKIGIHSIKIVGRNYSTHKKVNDVKFLKRILLYLNQHPCVSEEEFKIRAIAEYKDIYKTMCKSICYRCKELALKNYNQVRTPTLR
jgi:putative protease